MSEINQAVTRVIDEVVAPNAVAVDRDGTFPRENLDALAAAGVLGACSAPEVGGRGEPMRTAADVVQQLAGVCGSTAMVTMMHFAATAMIEAEGPDDIRRSIAGGEHLTTLAFSETGSRSHFWAPMSSARLDGDAVVLDAKKSWITSAGHADSYVWSSRPVAGDGPMTLWLVPSHTEGLQIGAAFDGLGLRGNASSPLVADGARVATSMQLGADGAGLDLALANVLPWFLVLSAAGSVGIMDAACADVQQHLGSARLDHLGVSLGQTPLARQTFARMRILTDSARALLDDCLRALESGREDAMLRVLEVKAAAGEAASEVTDLALKAGGGAAFRRESPLERRFRDARAARVMAPTTDALHDFVARALLGMPLLDGGA